MNCSQPRCHRPALFSCDVCPEERCANHCKSCDECGKTLCHSFDSMCYAAHECNPQKKAPETVMEIVERVTRVN